jgi:HAD domain in Swiss Army Knife RNA repair proteins
MSNLRQTLKDIRDFIAGVIGIDEDSKKRGNGNVYVFLDFDGVLHPEPGQYFSRKDVFEPALRKAHKMCRRKLWIVVSSAWRYSHTLDEMKLKFSPDIASIMIDVTPNEDYGFDTGGREKEIKKWMKQNDKEAEWIAIDDRASMFDSLNKLVLCDSKQGFTEKNAEDLFGKIKNYALTIGVKLPGDKTMEQNTQPITKKK